MKGWSGYPGFQNAIELDGAFLFRDSEKWYAVFHDVNTPQHSDAGFSGPPVSRDCRLLVGLVQAAGVAPHR